MMCLKFIFPVIFLISIVSSANILAIIPTPSFSHQIANMPLWRELSLRGHKVTLITTNPMKESNLKNLTEIDVNWTYKYFEDISKAAENDMNMWNIHRIFERMGLNISKGILTFPPVQNLIHKERNFDVIFVEFLFPEFLAFAKVYECPSILISSLKTFAVLHNAFGNPSHPVLSPEFTSPFFPPLSFKERLLSTLYNWYLMYHHSYNHYPEIQKIVNEYFGISLSIEELINNVDMMFINEDPIIHGARSLSPNTINIAGQRLEVKRETVPSDLTEFMNSARDGFIYFSLGSNVKSKDLSKETLTAIIETLTEVPYKVLWKFEADDLSWKPENVKLVRWAPQQNILSHPKIKLFITQGGLQSMEESIFNEVPLVVIPFFSDQEQNAKILMSRGIAETVGRIPSVNKEELKSAILKVLGDPRYKESVSRLKRLVLDVPMTGLEKAVWWTEYVIRNKGAKHLRNPVVDLPLYQYYLLDVIGFLILIIALVFLVLALSIKTLYTFIFGYLTNKILSSDKRTSKKTN